MKISVIGAGNVGGLAATRIAEHKLGEVVLLDIAGGLARGKAADISDARSILGYDGSVCGTDDMNAIKDSDIIVFTAGLARKPGMTREELLAKNAAILKEACLKIKELAPEAVLIVVTNPLDLMTLLALKTTGFNRKKVIGMGMTLDASRFANILAERLSVRPSTISACVIGSHGEGMLPLPRFTTVGSQPLDKLLSVQEIEDAVKRTVNRGQEIVSFLGSGSAFFAPSAAILDLVKIIVDDSRQLRGASVMLDGEYGLSDVCIGVPCRLGRSGIEEIVELELDAAEKGKLHSGAVSLKKLSAGI